MNNPLSWPPAYHRSVYRMQCSKCGAEANASCDCCAPYVPARQRAAEAVAAHPEKSDRAIAAEIGVSHTTLQQARQLATDLPVDEPRTGKDGKTRRLPSYAPDAPPKPQRPVINWDQVNAAMKIIREMDHDTWDRFDKVYAEARPDLNTIAF